MLVQSMPAGMTLKDEIERIIQAEQKKLDDKDQKQSNYYRIQCERFQPLRKVLEQILESVEKSYLRPQLTDSTATLEVGRVEGGHFLRDVRWEIEPNYKWGVNEELGALRGEPGFRIEETSYCYLPEYSENERSFTLASEQDVAGHLVNTIAKQIAWYRHLETLADRRKKQC
jgi:hypothetical protein